MASSLATIARLSDGRFRACFGTGYTAQSTIGQKAMPLDQLFGYVGALRRLLVGETVQVDGKAARMLHWAGMTAERPIDVPLWLSVMGPRGNERAPEVADGIIGPPHPSLPTATLLSGTVLEPDEARDSARVHAAIGPWRVVNWHGAYAARGAAAVDALPGGAQWRATLEALAPENERHLLTFEGHCTHLTERDKPLLQHIDDTTAVGDGQAMGERLDRMARAGFAEVIYTPCGPDVARELRAFAAVREQD
jgi:5,10-methylenetetrahydromethanopterin reductase